MSGTDQHDEQGPGQPVVGYRESGHLSTNNDNHDINDREEDNHEHGASACGNDVWPTYIDEEEEAMFTRTPDCPRDPMNPPGGPLARRESNRDSHPVMLPAGGQRRLVFRSRSTRDAELEVSKPREQVLQDRSDDETRGDASIDHRATSPPRSSSLVEVRMEGGHLVVQIHLPTMLWLLGLLAAIAGGGLVITFGKP